MTMTMTTGQTVWLAFATPSASDLNPAARVREATVLDAEHRIVRDVGNGHVSVIERWWAESVHATEAEAWTACASRLSAAAAAVQAEASRCEAKAAEAAAASRIVAVTA